MAVQSRELRSRKGASQQETKAFLALLALFVAVKGASELKRSVETHILGKRQSTKAAETTSMWGKSFKVVAGVPVDLSVKGALPFYLFTAISGSRALKVARHGTAAFKHAPTMELRNMLIFVFAGLPMLERFLAEDWSNPESSQFREGRRNDKLFRGSLYAWAAAEFLATYAFTKAALTKGTRPRDAVALAVFLGMLTGGFGITVAHELLHKPRASDKFVGRALLANVCYMHWEKEHLVGHHEHVATPADPASARRGQTLYEFLPQTLLGSLASSWRLHQADEASKGIEATKLGFALRNFGPSLLLAFALSKVTRRKFRLVLPFFCLQAAVGVLLLEMVNYIEHYGLARERREDGSYEPPNPTHSWNSAHWLSNAILFKLQRHSDHHTFPQRPFQLLRNFEESPQLPTGYPGMLALACFPPAFFHIMNPVVDSYNSNRDDAKVAEARAVRQFQVWNTALLATCVGSAAAYHRLC